MHYKNVHSTDPWMLKQYNERLDKDGSECQRQIH